MVALHGVARFSETDTSNTNLTDVSGISGETETGDRRLHIYRFLNLYCEKFTW